MPWLLKKMTTVVALNAPSWTWTGIVGVVNFGVMCRLAIIAFKESLIKFFFKTCGCFVFATFLVVFGFLNWLLMIADCFVV